MFSRYLTSWRLNWTNLRSQSRWREERIWLNSLKFRRHAKLGSVVVAFSFFAWFYMLDLTIERPVGELSHGSELSWVGRDGGMLWAVRSLRTRLSWLRVEALGLQTQGCLDSSLLDELAGALLCRHLVWSSRRPKLGGRWVKPIMWIVLLVVEGWGQVWDWVSQRPGLGSRQHHIWPNLL